MNARLNNLNAIHPKCIAQNISSNELIEIVSKSSIESDISKNVLRASIMKCKGNKRLKRKRDSFIHSPENTGENIKHERWQQKIFEIEKEAIQSIIPICKIDFCIEKSFSKCFLEEHRYRQKPMQRADLQSKIWENDINNQMTVSLNEITQRYDQNKFKKNHKSSNQRKKYSKKRRNFYSCADRFGISYSMIIRAHKKYKQHETETNILKKLRLLHMGQNQPPLKSDSSENNTERNMKKLFLLRTPYFMIPIIKKVQRKDSVENIYLYRQRLNRIRFLFNDRLKIDHKNHSQYYDDDINLNNKTNKTPKRDIQTKASYKAINSTKEKLFSIIRSNYQHLERQSGTCVSKCPLIEYSIILYQHTCM